MQISQTAGLIEAASPNGALSQRQAGSITILKRIVLTLQQAGVFPIVVLTGAEEELVRYQLSDYGVIFLHSEAQEPMDAVRTGLTYLVDKCGRVAYTPVTAPMFVPETLLRLRETPGDIVTPVYRGRGGHPVLLSAAVIPEICAWRGENGLRGALRTMEERRVRVNVDDEGILTSAHDQGQLDAQLSRHNRAILHPYIQIRFERENPFFNDRLKLLLFLLSDTENLRHACDQMALSVSKAWNMINHLEEELGYPVVERRRGGKNGGRTVLTDAGRDFLLAAQRYEEAVIRFAQQRFRSDFLERGMI